MVGSVRLTIKKIGRGYVKIGVDGDPSVRTLRGEVIEKQEPKHERKQVPQ